MTTKHTCRHCGGESPLRYRRGYKTLPIAEQIINAHGAPMRIREIFEAGRLLWPLRGATPQNTLYRDIALSILDDPKTPFVRVGKGIYTTTALVIAEMQRAEERATAAVEMGA